jgi:hypothetical protein
MPKITGPFWVYKRSNTKKFQVTLYPASGLPPGVCQIWKRRGFSRLPLELAVFRGPKTKAAETGVLTLTEHLTNQLKIQEKLSGKPPKGLDETMSFL